MIWKFTGRARRAQAIGVGALLLPSVLGVLMVGCFSNTAEMSTVTGPVTVQRTRVESDEPLVTSDWELQGNRVTGHLSWSSCETHRAWLTEQKRTVHMEPHTTLGGVLVLAGATLAAVGIASRNNGPGTPVCTYSTMPSGNESASLNTCTSNPPDNGTSGAEVALGAVVAVVGAVMYFAHPRDETTVVTSEPHSENATEPCIAPVDLTDLVLLLKLGKNSFLHVALSADGAASVEIPDAARLPRDVDLPIVVYRAPNGAEGLLKRWQVVGSLRVPPAQ